MQANKIFRGCVCAAALLSSSGCTVLAVATTAASAAGTAITVGITAGSVAVDAATTVAKGAVSAGSALLDNVEDD